MAVLASVRSLLSIPFFFSFSSASTPIFIFLDFFRWCESYGDSIMIRSDFSESLCCLSIHKLLPLPLLLLERRFNNRNTTNNIIIVWRFYFFCAHSCYQRRHRHRRHHRGRRRRHRRRHFRIARISDQYSILRHFLATVWWQAHLLGSFVFSILFISCCFFPPPHRFKVGPAARRPTAQSNPFWGWHDMIQLEALHTHTTSTITHGIKPKSATLSSQECDGY